MFSNPPTSAGARPSVLVADDHPQMLETVSRMLGRSFEVVATAADGRQALAAAGEHHPDAVILDVGMPGLDGFQTARELHRLGSRAPIVFLTMHDADDYVETAMDIGVRGYVVKTRMDTDLTDAVHHALDGRLFVPSLTSLYEVVGDSGVHAVQFRADQTSFVDECGSFFDRALRRGDQVAIVARQATRQGIARRLSALGWNLQTTVAEQRYSEVDALDALLQSLENGMPTRERISAIVADLERSRRVFAAGRPVRLTVAGEMSAILAERGNAEGAKCLESLWTELTRDLPFFTLCTYPAENFQPDADRALWHALSHQHTAVCHGQRSR
jgi:CheY-like chemotaxis protein